MEDVDVELLDSHSEPLHNKNLAKLDQWTMEETRDDGEDDDEIHKRLKLNGLQEFFRKLIKLLIILKTKIFL